MLQKYHLTETLFPLPAKSGKPRNSKQLYVDRGGRTGKVTRQRIEPYVLVLAQNPPLRKHSSKPEDSTVCRSILIKYWHMTSTHILCGV